MCSAQTRGKSQSSSTYWLTDMGETPAQNPHLISDLVPGVVAALAGKTNITPQTAAVWIKKTLLNLSETYPFEELRRVGPIVTIGPGLGYNGSNYEYLNHLVPAKPLRRLHSCGGSGNFPESNYRSNSRTSQFKDS